MTTKTPHPAVAELFSGTSLVVIAGPCVIESAEHCLRVATDAQRIAQEVGVSMIFKASFDKANRTSVASFRGPGMTEGLEILQAVKDKTGMPVLTDIHLPEQAGPVAEVVDVLQIPAFLCRQTDLLTAAGATKRPTNIKKGQFLSPDDMTHVVEKFRQGGGEQAAVTERGTTFGYKTLVVDMRGLETMRKATNCPVIFDATHSVQQPGGAGATTSGDRTLAPGLARAAAAVGIDGLFVEVHDNPDQAKSDGPNSLTYDLFRRVLTEVQSIDKTRRSWA